MAMPLPLDSHISVSQHTSHHLQPCRWQFQRQIRQKIACRPFVPHPWLPLWQIKQYWAGEICCGLTIDWHYEAGYIHKVMPGYVKNSLFEFQNTPPSTTQDAPSPWTCQPMASKFKLQIIMTHWHPFPLQASSFTMCYRKISLLWTCSWFNHNRGFKIPIQSPIPRHSTNHGLPPLVTLLHG